MIRALVRHDNGRPPLLMLGLSFGNLDRFRAQPFDTHITIKGEPFGLPVDIVIFSGETEQEILRSLAERIGPETKIVMDPRFKD